MPQPLIMTLAVLAAACDSTLPVKITRRNLGEELARCTEWNLFLNIRSFRLFLSAFYELQSEYTHVCALATHEQQIVYHSFLFLLAPQVDIV